MMDEAQTPWSVAFDLPFLYALSKNQIYQRTRTGQVVLSKQSREIRGLITYSTRQALRGVRVAHNKIWIGLHVAKPDHRGDAINVVDLVCDGIKDALPWDDRLFCLSCLDWSINKRSPTLSVEIRQDDVEDIQICGACGELLPLDRFSRDKSSKIGFARTCMVCVAAKRKTAHVGGLRAGVGGKIRRRGRAQETGT